jgi:hypothetical protein
MILSLPPHRIRLAPNSCIGARAGRSLITYDPACPIKGIESLNALLWTLDGDISDCEGLDLLESVEPGCRLY